ncbi:MAG: Gx transporter family protein [Bacteroidota bacterium]
MLSTTREVTTVAMLTAVGIALFVIESFIPAPFPFLKIGFANISSVITLFLLGAPQMFMVVVLRVVVGSILVGSVFTPGFLLAISGGLTSALAMGLAKGLTKSAFSPVGISMIGSLTHVVVQLLLVMLLYVQNPTLLFLLPLLLLSGAIGGFVVGWISLRLLPLMRSLRLYRG